MAPAEFPTRTLTDDSAARLDRARCTIRPPHINEQPTRRIQSARRVTRSRRGRRLRPPATGSSGRSAGDIDLDVYVDGRHEVQIRNFIATQGDVMLTMSVSGLRDFWWEVLQEGQEIAALMANSSASARRS